MILSSKIPFIDQNKNKMGQLRLAHSEYVKAMQFYLDLYWKHYRLDHYDFKKDALRQWPFYPKIHGIETIETPLSARMLKAAQTQVMAKIKSITSSLNKTYYVLELEQKKSNPDKIKIAKIQRMIVRYRKKITKPFISPNTPMELASATFLKVDNETKSKDAVYQFHSIWNREYKKENELSGKINFVINSHRHNQKLKSLGEERKSFLVSTSGFNIRYDIDTQPKRTTGTIAAIDQGITNCITMVDMNGNVQQSKLCNHGHDLKSILIKMRKRKAGSKNRRQTSDHRTNYVNWCINQLDLIGIREIRLEHLYDVGRGRNSGRFLKSFPYREIATKLEKTCLMNGVRFVESSNMYRSQRCSSCGFVHNGNRKGDVFSCGSCSHTEQADVNAAKNHLANITPILSKMPSAKTTGFYWTQ